jgi:hypothetical protein
MTSRRVLGVLPTLLLAAGLALAVTLGRPGTAVAARTQVAIIEDPRILSDPAGYLSRFRALGASTVRVILVWDFVAPHPRSQQIPTGFDPSDPAAYPATGWAPYDQIVRDAQSDGMTVDLTVSGGAPRWAEGSGIPPQGVSPYYAWEPNARLFGGFVHAAAERYDGSFTPAGAVAPLPAVHFWTLWNEPNFGQDLAPQAIDGSTVSVAPMMYRSLLDAGWSALQQTGHGGDTIIIGGFAAQGLSHRPTRRHPQGLPGDYAQTKPLLFIRTLYCLDSSYRPLRGRYALARGCPATASGSRSFRAANPGLFAATGVADHPYSGGESPRGTGRPDPNTAAFPHLGRLERVLDRVNRAYGSPTRYPLYSDEFGYITRPPQTTPMVSAAVAAYYLNWTEYLSWRSPRIASYAQYLLDDPRVSGGKAGFASGLFSSANRPKATYYAYRLPVYMPRTSLRPNAAAEVWGDVRPAYFMSLDTGQPQSVAIQLQAHGRGPYRTIRTVTVTSPEGYFDVPVGFPVGGNVRLAYAYPAGDPLLGSDLGGTTITSRIIKLQVR